MKPCVQCKETKDLNEFHFVKNRHIAKCKVCIRAYLKARYRERVPVRMKDRLFPEPGKKLCSRCKEVKPLDGFRNKSNGSPDAACRMCMRTYQREYVRAKARKELNKRWEAIYANQGASA